MNSLKRGASMAFAPHGRDGSQIVEIVSTSNHFNTVQAKLERELEEKKNQAGAELDHLQELRMFMNELGRYKLKLLDKVWPI